MTKKKATKKEYTWEFQQKAVSLVKSSGRPASAIAMELGVPVWRMRNWMKEAAEKEDRSVEVNELISLRNENKQLKEDLEFLKKAAAYFAKNQ
jgi:transposase